MADMRFEVEQTLREPDTVRKSHSAPDSVRLYYKWFDVTTVGNKWVTVVVRVLADDDAFVLTAYATGQLKTGEEIWPNEIR